MGDLADGITEGEVCQDCLYPLDEVHGYPVSCSECDNEGVKRWEECVEPDGDYEYFRQADLNAEVEWESRE